MNDIRKQEICDLCNYLGTLDHDDPEKVTRNAYVLLGIVNEFAFGAPQSNATEVSW